MSAAVWVAMVIGFVGAVVAGLHNRIAHAWLEVDAARRHVTFHSERRHDELKARLRHRPDVGVARAVADAIRAEGIGDLVATAQAVTEAVAVWSVADEVRARDARARARINAAFEVYARCRERYVVAIRGPISRRWIKGLGWLTPPALPSVTDV